MVDDDGGANTNPLHRRCVVVVVVVDDDDDGDDDDDDDGDDDDDDDHDDICWLPSSFFLPLSLSSLSVRFVLVLVVLAVGGGCVAALVHMDTVTR